MSEGESSARPYLLAWLVLMLLTAVSYGLSYGSLGALGPVLALLIALFKALVVVLVFMHLASAMLSTKLVVFMNLLFVVLLCMGIVADVAFR